MIQTLTRNRWLLVLCGTFEAAIAALYFTMYEAPLSLHFWHIAGTWTGRLGLAAGACAIVGGMLGRNRCWLLVANGVAMAALGLIQVAFMRYPIRFLTIAALIILMAVSLGLLEWVLAQTMRREQRAADRWILDVAAAISGAFALGFLVLGLGLPSRPDSHPDIFWLGAFFGFSAICMLGLPPRVPPRVSYSPQSE